jgi:hypothetical protein
MYEASIKLTEYIDNKDALEFYALIYSFDIDERADLLQTFTDTLPYGQRGKGSKFLGAFQRLGFDMFETLCGEVRTMMMNDDDMGLREILDESSDELVNLLTEKIEGLNYER